MYTTKNIEDKMNKYHQKVNMYKVKNYKKSLLILFLLINVINSDNDDDDEIAFYDQFNLSIPIKIMNEMMPYKVTSSNSNNNNDGINNSSIINGSFINTNETIKLTNTTTTIGISTSTLTSTTSATFIKIIEKPSKKEKILTDFSEKFKNEKIYPRLKDINHQYLRHRKDDKIGLHKMFNLDDLENAHHESFNRRNDNLSDEEMHLLQDNDDTLNSKKKKYQFLPTPLPDDMIIAAINTTSIFTPTTITTSTTPSILFPAANNDIMTTRITQLIPIPTTTSDTITDHITLKSNSKIPKSKIKIHEYLKGHSSIANFYNSVNNHISNGAFSYNGTEYSNYPANNYFRIMINLFDHFDWEPSQFRLKLSTVCGVELYSYLSALNANVEWAQKAYDSSGRYRGQILFGNDLWLGQKLFCDEINFNNKKSSNRKHFEFGFFIARVQFTISTEKTNLSKILQIGECLPNSCTLHDIEMILKQDLQNKIPTTQQQNFSSSSSSNENLSNHQNDKFKTEILSVRHIPGPYVIWNDPIFQILSGICATLISIVLIATIYESCLLEEERQKQQMNNENFDMEHKQQKINNENKSLSSLIMSDMKKKKSMKNDNILEENNDKSIKSDENCNGKSIVLELYQISTAAATTTSDTTTTTTTTTSDTNQNNNNTDCDSDLEHNHNNNNHRYQNHQHNHNNNNINNNNNSNLNLSENNHTRICTDRQNNSNGKNESFQESLQVITEENNCIRNGKIPQHRKYKKIGIQKQILLCFALGSNSETILSVDRNPEEIITCVHGIRVFSLLWTIMVHTYLQVFTIGENRFRRNISERTFLYQIIGNATFSVDSFFFISGLLVCLIFQRNNQNKMNNKNNDNVDRTNMKFLKNGFCQTFIMIIYRYIRLTPAYLFAITFNLVSLRYIFNTSVFQPTISDHITCSKYWWRNILYINNFYPFKDLCMIWSWYLANDTQFYLMAIILLIASTRYFKVSVIILLTFLITSWGTSGVFSLYHNYTHKVAEPFESFDFLYDKPWQRIGTYIIGMITGYIIHKVRRPQKISFLLNSLLWLASVGIIFSLIFDVWNGELSIISTAFYVSIGHTAWGLGLVWITLSCCWGYSNTINKILSYRGFLPLSRLTYCTYLIHPIIMLIISFQMEGPIHLDHLFILTIFMGNAVLSFIMSFIISVLFEAPVIRLLKIFLR